MICPKCKDTNLTPTRLDNSLAVMGCQKCGGTSIPLLYYRDWAERYVPPAEGDIGTAIEEISTDDTRATLNCPKCRKVMTKFHIAGHLENRIDLCAHCDEAWLDGGEWELLSALKLSKQIPKVFTDAWQQKVRREKSSLTRRAHFEKSLGEEDISRAEAFKEWVINHPKRAEIMLYLNLELNNI